MSMFTKNLMRQGLGIFTSFTLVLGLAVPLSGNAATIQFTQGGDIGYNHLPTGIIYSYGQDVELREADPDDNFDEGTGGTPPNAEGTIDGSDPGGSGFTSQVLVAFPQIFGPDPGQIPFGVEIYYASLHIDFDNDGDPISVFALNIPFDETIATWNSLVNGIDGADIGVHIANLIAPLNNEVIDVTTYLQTVSDGASNFGWAFLPGAPSFSDGADFDLSEHGDLSDRPTLYVAYGSVPEPGTLALLVLGLSGISVTRRKRS